MSDEKQKTVTVFDYLVAKDGKTKYLKLNDNPKADPATKKLVEDIRKALGGDILFVNLLDAEFKAKYKIPDFVKGRINAPVTPESSTSPSTTKAGDIF